MMTSSSPLSLEVASFKVIDCLDVGSRVSCSTSSAMAALHASRVSSRTLVLVRSMMTVQWCHP